MIEVIDDADDRFDRLLAAWARQQRLGPRQADEIVRAITGQPRGTLPVTWWSDLSAQVSAAVVLATSLPATTIGKPAAATAY